MSNRQPATRAGPGSSNNRNPHGILNTYAMRAMKAAAPSEPEIGPAGRYLVDFKYADRKYRMSIYKGRQPGLFEATFNFPDYKGIILLGADNRELDQYSRMLDREYDVEHVRYTGPGYISDGGDSAVEDEEEEEAEEEEEEEDDDDDSVVEIPNPYLKQKDNKKEEDDDDVVEIPNPYAQAQTGSKRKAPPVGNSTRHDDHQKTAQVSKRPKIIQNPTHQNQDFLARIRFREKGEMMIMLETRGTLKFHDQTFRRFTAVLDIDEMGRAVVEGQKIGDPVNYKTACWSNYSQRAYDFENRARWKEKRRW